MNRTRICLFALALLTFGLGSPESLRAEDLTVEAYCDFTVAHLKLIANRWEETGERPTQAEEEALFQQFGLTPEVYYAFAASHVQEIEGYLETKSEVRQSIEQLSARIRRLIEQAERE